MSLTLGFGFIILFITITTDEYDGFHPDVNQSDYHIEYSLPNASYATPQQVAWFGRFVSFFVAALALVLALTWKGSIISIYQMGTPMAMQLVLIFLVGLFMKD